MASSNDSQPSEKAKGKANECVRNPTTEEAETLPISEKAAEKKEEEPCAKRPKTTNDETRRKSDPPVGSEKWKELKRASHSQVERRRRDNITVCINELAELVPTEKQQKEAILRSAVDFIKGAKQQHDLMLRKWTLEKLVADQAFHQMQNDIDKYKQRYERLRAAVKKAGHDDLCDDSSDDNDDGDEGKETSPAL